MKAPAAMAVLLCCALVSGCTPARPSSQPEAVASRPVERLAVAVPERTATPPPSPPPPPQINARRLTRTLDRYLASRPGRITATVVDLTTGRAFRYRRGLRLPTASTIKVQILMGVLLTTPWERLSPLARDRAERMIRYSDNHAADRLWERLGHSAGLRRASKRFGLKHTTSIDARCIDIYCWGIARTSADDQVRLMRQLIDDDSPLPREDRRQVLRLMRQVVPAQRWGVSAGACRGDTVALKNGWLHHVSNRLWVIDTIGLIAGRGHVYAVAVLSEDNPTMSSGIARVEGTVKRIMKAFRGPQGCTARYRT